MKILFLTQVLPYPLDAGPKVRQYHMLRWLAARHEVTLVSFVRADDRPEAVAHLRGISAGVHAVPLRRSMWRNAVAGVKGLLTGLPMTIVRDETAEMAETLRGLTREVRFDVIHADQLSMAWWGRLARHLAQDPAATAAAGAATTLRDLRMPARPREEPNAPRTLLDEHNAIYLLTERMAATERNLLRRLIMRREAHAFRRYEAAMLAAYDAVLTVTEEDRGRLEGLLDHGLKVAGGRLKGEGERGRRGEGGTQSAIENQKSKFTVVPICVDPEQVAVAPRRAGGGPTILHLGTMFWPPNVTGVLWFAREVLPLIHAVVPEARFVIVGKNPPAEVQALAADPRIEVTGYAADATPYLTAADAFVTPLHAGGGMRVKILDAWLWGLPIVSTPIGAEGIELADGENILIAEGASEFAAATVRLLTDPALNGRLRAAGRAWVEARYAWRTVYRRVDEVYDGLKVQGCKVQG